MAIIKRSVHTDDLTITVASAAMTSSPVEIKESVTGAIRFPSAWTSSNIQVAYHGAPTLGGTYNPILDSNGAASTASVVASSWRPLPAEVMTVPAFKVVAAVAEAANRTFKVALKS